MNIKIQKINRAVYKYWWFAAYFLVLLDRGGFESHTTFFALFICLLSIIGAAKKRGYLLVENRQCLFYKSLIVTGGMLSALTGIDCGESIYGLLRLITILVMEMAVQQLEERDKKAFLYTIPFTGIFLLMGCFFHNFSIFQGWVSGIGRFNGSFGYSNTMALFLLLGIIIAEHFYRRGRRVIQLVLAVGVLATGSRTAFVILCGYLVFIFVRYKGRNKNILFVFSGIVGLIGFISVSGGNLHGMSRFLKLGINASTFQGRLLYWEDAIRMLAKKPVGLGYMGYFYFQQVEQTGVYSVRFVHNEWIQWVLDYGILAGIGLAMYLYHQCKWRNIPAPDKELMCVIAIYSFFDFHMQFFSIIFIALMLIPKGNVTWMCGWERKKQRMWKYGLLCGTGLSLCLCIATGIAEYYADVEDYNQAVKWNPFSAQYKQQLLLQSENLEAADIYADSLLGKNKYLYAAYLIKSNAAAQKGQLDNFIENRRKVLRLRKYKVNEYEEYFEILFNWYLNSYENGNMKEREMCLAAMKEIPELITDVKRKTSLRAYRIQEKPEIAFKNDYINLIKQIEGSKDE